ncbi:alpha-ketoglutarate-dependent dioxygenase AlkB-like [Vigna umbellata]|uniref:alpha-ketoglutarate-dependent dioxygenase AlkB-like n=1 Tax=Vigna umbellata TaxID=87088 RepID=UPI001F5E74B1|nr:alpha-ketoglutarate-dependent dioxygenase AlkB-like [Vigna umbellata]
MAATRGAAVSNINALRSAAARYVDFFSLAARRDRMAILASPTRVAILNVDQTRKVATFRRREIEEGEEDGRLVRSRDLNGYFEYHACNKNSNSNYAAVGDQKLDSSVSKPVFRPYDICFHGRRNRALIEATLPGENNESKTEKHEERTKGSLLRPGMVLLKNFISHDEQVDIVKVCRELGLGLGGFYQPGYSNGAKLQLKMMCLGMDWNPRTYKYGNKRIFDGSTPPSIPNHFSELVRRAIQEAQSLTKKEYRASKLEDILPSMTPDICIVNFYTKNGKLGLHQDRDESRESLRKELPVVSFSIGDSADFLYGDERNVHKAEGVILESGDVLIFGGESRRVFHGVRSVLPNSAPKELLRDSGFSPGRLNLTFRQY